MVEVPEDHRDESGEAPGKDEEEAEPAEEVDRGHIEITEELDRGQVKQHLRDPREPIFDGSRCPGVVANRNFEDTCACPGDVDRDEAMHLTV